MCYFVFTSSIVLLLVTTSLSFAYEVSYDNRAFIINGERKLIISGAIHYPRSTPGMWQDLISKAKRGGLNTIETYVFWNAHEPNYREYDFSGRLDLVRFIKTIHEEGLYAILRIGPYVCAEWNYGGFPVWLHSLPGIEFRINNTVFKNEMQTFVSLIVDMMKKEKLFAPQGGPIIMSQIENEYGNGDVIGPYRDHYGNAAVNDYINWCANLAVSMQTGVPWIMCQQANPPPPSPLVEASNGHYSDNYYPKNRSVPKLWTENWIGWFQEWGGKNPHRTAEDCAFAVARFYQRDGTLMNYYMYHGGTNFGTSGGGPYITTSYDYDSPLDEYGNLRQPKWGHLRELHLLLLSMEKTLTYGVANSTDSNKNMVTKTIFTYEGNRSCFFSNRDSTDYTITFEGKDYIIPAWSVSILPDCKTVVYNTARVNVQTSVMVTKPNDAKTDNKLEWQWQSEKPLHLNDDGIVKGSTLTANELLDQKIATNGTSDYLWILTTYNHNVSDPKWNKKNRWNKKKRLPILHVHTNGHVVHAFVNGKYSGSLPAKSGQQGGDFIFENPVQFKHGNNRITLVSVTAGLQNYGALFDEARNGILGPVKMIARNPNGVDEDLFDDISTNRWVYKTGLQGVDLGYHQVQSTDRHHHHHHHDFKSSGLPNNEPFVWYKTTFSAPMGTDPVVVDLIGMKKGVVWVNGHNIGRYWPQAIAPKDGCDEFCDYRGDYRPKEKCQTGCGQPTQRYYHIPRDILKPDNNLLVLFEEFGGTPDSISIQTVTVGKVCAKAYERERYISGLSCGGEEGHTLKLSCQGDRTFSNITFASFGLPDGRCGAFTQGECHVDALPIVRKACLGKESCSIEVSKDAFGSFTCNKTDTYRLAVEAFC